MLYTRMCRKGLQEQLAVAIHSRANWMHKLNRVCVGGSTLGIRQQHRNQMNTLFFAWGFLQTLYTESQQCDWLGESPIHDNPLTTQQSNSMHTGMTSSHLHFIHCSLLYNRKMGRNSVILTGKIHLNSDSSWSNTNVSALVGKYARNTNMNIDLYSCTQPPSYCTQ